MSDWSPTYDGRFAFAVPLQRRLHIHSFAATGDLEYLNKHEHYKKYVLRQTNQQAATLLFEFSGDEPIRNSLLFKTSNFINQCGF